MNNSNPINPETFAKEMEALVQPYDAERLIAPSAANAEKAEQKAVLLMAEMLKQLGYEEGVQIFFNQLMTFSAP